MTRVAVIGGGLAGITAALRCADAGCEVRLLESKPWLGGLTHSWRRDDAWVDNGQHVFLRCCTSYLALLDRMGVSDLVNLQSRLDIQVRSALSPRACRLRRNRMPAPLHLLGSIAGYRWLTLRERLRFARAALALRSVDTADPRTDEQTFGDWLVQHGQSPRAIEALWELVSVATLNARAHDASLSLAATVFQVGLLRDGSAGDLGWPLVPLRTLHGDAAARALAQAGVDVLTRRKVTALRQAGGWSLDAGQAVEVTADAVVLAVPPAAAERLLPAAAIDLPAGWSGRLGASPIVNVHVRYDRQVLDEPFLAAVDGPVQWVFDRTRSSGVRSGQYLVVSLSAAQDLIDLPTSALCDLLLPGLQSLLPRSRNAAVQEVFVTRERQATFWPAPGSARLRPPSATSVPGLFLAGAWTDTGWPATMEGAVRSGDNAARMVLQSTPSACREVAA
ncbi:MAG: hydroxysqualene dehydroxylase HpnE [Nocardioidaceae bacterium]